MLPYANSAKYLDTTCDAKLKWKERVKKKKEELHIRYETDIRTLSGFRPKFTIRSDTR